jgi:glyoxylase-like metal-dependent hydrolase (beta-lactamase superfamily II)
MPRFREVLPDLFSWTDTCNVYVLRDGDAALLIDLGDGSVLDHLGEIGVKRVEWVLFTHHHREQCQGGAKLAATGAKVATSAIEKPLFENPASYRKLRPTLGDAFTVHGASYVRPPVDPISVDRTFARMDDFVWRGHELWVVETQGNSPGHTSFVMRHDNQWYVFTGDLIVDGAKMHTWYDTEWDYGFAKGLYELGKSASQIAGYDPALLFPAHGPVIRNARTQLLDYVLKLRHLGELYVRGYDVQKFDGCDQDTVSRPTVVPHLWQLTPHLYKFRGPNYAVNFAMLLADNCHALIIDCGLFNREFLDTAIQRMRDRLGLKVIDAVFVTHMHGDHGMEADYMRTKYGAKLWTMEGVDDKFERPWDYDLCALLPSYQDPGKGLGPFQFDRVLRNGEVIEWEGIPLCCDWMPGQTKYHACLHGEIDGRRVAFTGDNIFGSTTSATQGGNEAVVARNGGTLEEGYIYAANYLHSIGPDLLVGGHCWVMDQPQELIERYRQRMLDLRSAFQALSAEDDYRIMFDPYWVSACPYRVAVKPGKTATVNLIVRNYRSKSQQHRIVLHPTPGIAFEPAVVQGSVEAGSTATIPVTLTAASNAATGMRVVALDITANGQRLGELFDFLVHVGDIPETKPSLPNAADKGTKY